MHKMAVLSDCFDLKFKLLICSDEVKSVSNIPLTEYGCSQGWAVALGVNL
jgi:hypothetical protein